VSSSGGAREAAQIIGVLLRHYSISSIDCDFKAGNMSFNFQQLPISWRSCHESAQTIASK
jgi:hypothetical protein